MTRLALTFLLALTALAAGLVPGRAPAYSYVAVGKEPLLLGREALFAAVLAGDWPAAAAAFEGMRSDVAYLDANDDPGLLAAFTDALAAHDAAAVTAAFQRAAKDEVARRLNGARDNFGNYQIAKALVVTANSFFVAIEADLPPDVAEHVRAEMKHAIDAVGNPGVFGVGTLPADPQDFAEARAAILEALGMTP